MKKYKAIVFDMGGTLINTIPYKNSSCYSAIHKLFLITFGDKGACGECFTYQGLDVRL